jgi:hypothetical protein
VEEPWWARHPTLAEGLRYVLPRRVHAAIHSDELVATFEVEGAWKGVELTRTTAATDAWGCGYRFRVGARYLVYGYGEDRATGLCTRTAEISLAGDDLKELGPATLALRDPPPTGRVLFWGRVALALAAGGFLVVRAVRRRPRGGGAARG